MSTPTTPSQTKKQVFSDYTAEEFARTMVWTKGAPSEEFRTAYASKSRDFKKEVSKIYNELKAEEARVELERAKKAEERKKVDEAKLDDLLKNSGEVQPKKFAFLESTDEGLGDMFDVDDDEEALDTKSDDAAGDDIKLIDFENVKTEDIKTLDNIEEKRKYFADMYVSIPDDEKESYKVQTNKLFPGLITDDLLNKAKGKSEDKKKSPVKNPLTSVVSVKTKGSTMSKSTWDIASVISDITDFEVDAFDTDFSECDYDGFNPEETIKLLAAYAENDKLDYNDFIEDMKFLSPFVVLRGTNLTSILDRSTDKIKAKMRILINRYNIDKGDKKGFVGKDKIILSRIPACFPMFASTALQMKKIEAKCKKDDLPLYLHHSAAASLIPTTSQDLFDKWLEWAKEHDKLINGKSADADKVVQFGNIVWRSAFISNIKRQRFATKMSKLNTAK